MLGNDVRPPWGGSLWLWAGGSVSLPSMPAQQAKTGYRVWGADDVVYGPFELPEIVDLIGDERILPGSWVFNPVADEWRKAGDLVELRAIFSRTDRRESGVGDTATIFNPLIPSVRTFSLRRVRALAAMSDQQLGRFARMMEVQSARPFEVIVRQGDPGDALFLILEGEVRVRLLVNEHESTLATLGAGDFFGETCLFERTVRSADVVTNQESLFLKISMERFQKLVAEAPDVATPFLLAMSKTLTARIRADNKRFHDFVAVRLATSD